MLFAMTVARFCAKMRIDKQAKAKTAKSLLMNVSFDGLSDNRRTADKLVRKLLGTAAIEFRRSGTITNPGTEVPDRIESMSPFQGRPAYGIVSERKLGVT
jgi:hypothetical protein